MKKLLLLIAVVFLHIIDLHAQVALPINYQGPWQLPAAGWTATGLNTDGANYCGAGTTRARFNTVGDRLQVFFAACPYQLSFCYGSNVAGGQFDVEESVDGVVWTMVADNLLCAVAAQTFGPFTLRGDSRYVRWTTVVLGGANNLLDNVIITNGRPAPLADFSASATSVIVGQNITFTDLTSNGPTTWSWDFGGGGTPNISSVQNPFIQFHSIGTYTVTLTATSCAGSDPEVKVNYITVSALPPPVANFSASDITPAQLQCINFSDLSTNSPTSWLWDFGGGGTPNSSIAQNPAGICFNVPGTYTITLTATNGSGADAEVKVNYITVAAATCSDGVQNQGETCVDGGGPCAPCSICNFTVINTLDAGAGSLRDAITQANAAAPGPINICFSIASGSTIALASDLPAITHSDLTIDATTVPGYVANAVAVTLNATGRTNGLYVNGAANVKIYGLQVYGATTGININGDAADGFVIGAAGKRNFINRCTGWQIQVTNADNGLIQNNYVGCNTAGTAGYATSNSGIYFLTTANGNTIGGAAAGEGNLIAGGTGAAFYIGTYFGTAGSGCSNNRFYGNRIGGTGANMPWWSWAFWIDGDSDNNIIGGIAAGQGNDISYATNGNTANGYGNLVIAVNEINADGNQIRGNNMDCAFGYGIQLVPNPNGGNNNQATPVITGYASPVLSGTSSVNANIDIYVGSLCNSVYGACKGAAYIASTVADGSGNWSIDLTPYSAFSGSSVVVTATTAVNGTSQFTACYGPLTISPPPPAGCNGAGNVFLFSNYDGSGNTAGTRLNINVDVNIPNIKIGICSYERVTVDIGGAFVGNVTQVIYAGYNAMGNNHCGSVGTTVITGVAPGIISYVIMPPSTYSDPNGNNTIICAYQCTGGSQGGCNTPGQIVGYFLSAFGGGSVFKSHETQYGCWGGVTKNLSTSGNCCLTPLPIELLSFNTSNIDNKTVLAKWSTASEINNDFFTIERSKDAFNYEPIGQIKGAGNSNIILNYSFIDNYPFSGVNYYRLKQTDFDGKYSYSDVSAINMNDSENSDFTIFPNPANTALNCLLYSEEEVDAIYKIKDVTGKVLLQGGFKSIEHSIDISSLSAGIYFIQIVSGETTSQGRFIKR